MKSGVETCKNFHFQTIFTLEKVKEITNQAPETRHEEWFQETYGDLISEALLKLTTPEDPTNPGNCWTAFKQVRLGLKHRHLFPTRQKRITKFDLHTFSFSSCTGACKSVHQEEQVYYSRWIRSVRNSRI